MPYITEKEAINDPFLDRRVKMLPCQKEMALYWYNKGYSLRAIARIFKVDKRTISYLISPEQLEESLKRRSERGGSNIYYNKEYHKNAIKRHRHHKHSLLKDITIPPHMIKEQDQANIKEMPLKRQLEGFMTVARYAKEMGVAEPTIYKRIRLGEIVPELVGWDKLVMIEFEKYKHVTFAKRGQYERKPKERKDLAE